VPTPDSTDIVATPHVPASAVTIAKIGGTIALAAAAAMSFQTLLGLARILGYARWNSPLLPLSLDVYAATAISVGYRIPAGHRARTTATTNAALALALTVCCNGLYHWLALAGPTISTHLRTELLVAVSALPPIVVERILHLQRAVSSGPGTEPPGTERHAQSVPDPARATRVPARPVAPAPGTDTPIVPPPAPARAAQTTGTAPGTRTAFETWVERAVPLWHEYVGQLHNEPTAPVLANRVRLAHPEPNAPSSPRWDRKLAAAVKLAATQTVEAAAR
jgi:hypothetical protein